MGKVTRDRNFHVNFAYLFITSNYITFKSSGWGDGGKVTGGKNTRGDVTRGESPRGEMARGER